jgi:O-antigen/teichoic acid export membrane protein
LTLADDLLIDPDPSMIGKRASRGVMYLLLRYGGVQVTGLVANIALSRLLSPDSYGIYAITLFVLVAMAFLSDFGLGPALLQKQASVSERDLGTVFTVQQVVLGALLIVVFLAAPGLASVYHLGPSGVWYFRAIALAGMLASLKTVPTIVLERQLLYGRLTLVDGLEVILFQGTAVLLALLHNGAWSFIWAVIVSKAAGCLMSYVLSGWRPAIRFTRSAFQSLWTFAAPFQLIWITYLLRDYMIPILGGLLVSTTEVGYLNWALALAAVPGQMAQIVGRVSFPSFSRLQADPQLLRRAIETSIRALFLVAVPFQLALFSLAPWLIEFVFSSKWTPALLPLYLLCIHWTGANLTSPLVSALNAIGKPRTALVLNVAWTVATLVLAVLLVRLIGYVGFALAYATTMVGAATAAVLVVNRSVRIDLWPQVRLPVAAALVIALGGCLAVRLLPASPFALVVVGIAMGLGYMALVWLAEGARLRADITNLVRIGRPAAGS